MHYLVYVSINNSLNALIIFKISELMQRFQKKVPENSSTKGPTTLSRTTFSIMTLSIMGLTATLSIATPSISVLCHYAEVILL